MKFPIMLVIAMGCALGCEEPVVPDAVEEAPPASLPPVTEAELSTWMQQDPDVSRIVDVVRSPERDRASRVRAAMALVHSYGHRDDVDGTEVLSDTLADLQDREGLVAAIRDALWAQMEQEQSFGPSLSDAIGLSMLAGHMAAPERERTRDRGVTWVLVECETRCGRGAEIATAFAVGPARAARLVEALDEHVSPDRLVPISIHVSEHAPEARSGLARRLVAISRAHETEAFEGWLRARLARQLTAVARPGDAPMSDRRLDAIVLLNQRNYLCEGAIVALGGLREIDEARARLEELAADPEQSRQVIEAAETALR